MLRKNIKYTDYDGNERSEDFFFNLSKAELTEMQLGVSGGLDQMVAAIVKAQNVPEIIRIFKKIILASYGEKSADGRRFIKTNKDGQPLGNEFAETEAYSVLFTELASDSKAAADFINGIVPSDLEVSEEKQKEIMKQYFPENETKEISSSEITE